VNSEIEFEPLTKSLLQQDVQAVANLLKADPLYININKSTSGAANPLLLSANWPQGLKLLLELGGERARSYINATDDTFENPIYSAMHFGNARSVEILLQSGVAYDFDQLCRHYSEHDEQSEEIIDMLVDGLVIARKELLACAIERLPLDVISDIGLTPCDLLDEKAATVASALRHQGISLPSNVQSHSLRLHGSVYEFCSIHMAKRLYAAGFQAPNAFSPGGITPIMTRQYLCRISKCKPLDRLDLI